MKEFVFVWFVAKGDERDILIDKLQALKEDFQILGTGGSTHVVSREDIHVVTGNISSQYASLIKLQDPFLSERMRISYIPDELKDRYRK